VTRHVFRARRLSDIDPERQKFAVDARGSPERIGPRQLPDKIPDLASDLGSARLTTSALPPPMETEPFSMPADDGR